MKRISIRQYLTGGNRLPMHCCDVILYVRLTNEWYARDISRKVTKAMRTRFENGAHYAAHAPLGYRKDPEQVGHLLVDDETKWIVEKIYALAVQGAGASKITHILAAEQIPTPSWLNFQRSASFLAVFPASFQISGGMGSPTAGEPIPYHPVDFLTASALRFCLPV